jgi:hypothetical protein
VRKEKKRKEKKRKEKREDWKENLIENIYGYLFIRVTAHFTYTATVFIQVGTRVTTPRIDWIVIPRRLCLCLICRG